MKKQIIKTPAKINLYLHVTGKDRRGYHLLDTLVCFLPDLSDTITIKEIDQNNHIIDISGPWKEQLKGPNIIEATLSKISHLLETKFHINLEKNILVGAGLGGGSSNAAHILLHILRQYKIKMSEQDVLQILSALGSDVPMFHYNKALYALGTGEVIFPLESFPDNLFALLVYPKKPLETKKVYENYNAEFTQTLKHNYRPDIHELIALLQRSKNDLYQSSIELLPELENILLYIKSLEGCIIARMSGSGSASFGLFTDQNKLNLAERFLKEKLPNFFITKSKVN
ncbi:MAG: 4-(cytidine 5'-diphospho)-2-C-methyl-D-erythritol kinase [Rickettsiales bacterium]|nr:4-(cytidine 5'-diphospho)-2-C-methyl-D-erythritol kinase [Rickettsiales bacterium]